MFDQPLYVLGILCLSILISEWLVRRTVLKHLGTALVVIILMAVLANIGLVPSASNSSPVYGGIFKYVAPISIFFLLLDVNLNSIRRAGAPMLILFGIGSLGTMLGVMAGMYLIDGSTVFGAFYPAISGMFTGTYTGGSVNFNAVAIHYNMMEEGEWYAGMVAVDNIITAFWMVVTLLVPALIRRLRKNKADETQETPNPLNTHEEIEQEPISIITLSILLCLGLFTLLFSEMLATWLSDQGINFPSILILTTIALILAQLPVIQRMSGAHILGLFSVYLFLAVIGAFCEFSALGKMGDMAFSLLILVITIVMVHGLLIFSVAWIGKQDWDVAAVASQANIGGSSSALALAKSIGRMDLYLPGILLGSLGNGVGTYLGFLVAGWMGG